MVRLIGVLLTFLSFSVYAQSFTAPTPDWVLERAMPDARAVPHEDVQAGVHYRLLDFQMLASIPVQDFSHFALEILNQTGVEQQSQINLDYDPSYQQLSIHAVDVVRDGQRLDRLATADIKTLQRESELENLIHTGLTTVNIVLKDIRAGDLLEYSYTITGTNPVHNNHFSAAQRLNWSVPVDALWLELIWPRNYPLHIKTRNTDVMPEISQEGQQTRYSLKLTDTPSITRQDDAPEWFSPWSSISFSEFSQWTGVVQWALPLYATPAVPTAEVQAIAHKIQLQHTNRDDQIAEALRYAQGEIRYLGLELGQDSHRPASSALTLERRFGDCKAKAILFVEILHALGIEAYPALVNTQIGPRLQDVQPGINAFDHVIAWLEFDGKSYWLDPTRRPQPGQLNDIYNPQFGYGLIVKPGQTQLTPMAARHDNSYVEILDNYLMSDSDQASLTIHSRYHGAEAERMRANFESSALSNIAEDYLEYYADRFGTVSTTEPLQITDTVVFETDEHYQLDTYWSRQNDSRTADLPAYYLQDFVAKPDTHGERTQPYNLAFPKNIRQTIVAHLPSDQWNFDNNQFELDGKFFTFSFSEQYDADQQTLTLTYDYRALANHVPADKFQVYLNELEQIQDYVNYGIYQQPNVENTWLQSLSPIDFALAIAAIYLLIFIAWLISRKLRPVPESKRFMPVSLAKFVFMYIMTFGVYGLYWFWANFRALKQMRQDASMPAMRALFSQFWFIALWRGLRQDSETYEQGKHMPANWIGMVFALLYFLALIVSMKSDFGLIFYLIPLLLLPMVNYIAHVNVDQTEAMRYHSSFGARQLLLALISTPLLLLGTVASTGLTPSERVIKGDALWPHARKEIVRLKAMKADDHLLWYYSDGFLSFRDDGNGLTERHVFSYWLEDDEISVETAEFSEIADIKVARADQWAGNTTVTIIRHDSSEFVLFLSSVDGSDKPFIEALNQRWRSAQTAGGSQ